MAEKMNLIKLSIQEVHGGKQVGLIKGEPVKIQLREGAVPFHCNTARRVPIPLMPKVKQELIRMGKMLMLLRKSLSPLIGALRWWWFQNKTEM